MKLLFKQRLFSRFDSYDIYDEQGNRIYRKGKAFLRPLPGNFQLRKESYRDC